MHGVFTNGRALLQCSLLIGNLIGYLVLPSSNTISGTGLMCGVCGDGCSVGGEAFLSDSVLLRGGGAGTVLPAAQIASARTGSMVGFSSPAHWWQEADKLINSEHVFDDSCTFHATDAVQ